MSNDRHGYFTSDLHLFTRRSQADQHMQQIYAAASQAHTFVLGGDIFDFKWSRLPTIRQTVDAADDWLRSFAARFPHCRIRLLLGNHDSHSQFVERLGKVAEETHNLDWHPYYLRLQDCLFLHGDAVDGRVNQRSLAARRARVDGEHRTRRFEHDAYEAAIALRLHKLVNLVLHRRRSVAERLLYYLQEIEQGPREGVKHVYFGHTHAAMSDYEHRGLTFHNGGAPISGLAFRVVRTALANEEDDAEHVD